MSEPLSDLDLTALAHAKAVEALEDQAVATMAKAWAGVVKALEGDLEQVLTKVAKARAAGKPLSPAWVFQEDRVRVLLANARANATQYAQVAARATTQVQAAAAQHGHAAAQAAVDRATAGLGASFAAATPETLGVAVGFLADGSPLASLLATLGQDAAAAVSDAIVQGVTLGHGVDVMRRAAMSAGNLPRHRAETIVRTEAMRVYREAHRQTYLANDDVLTGWTWRAHLDSATCVCCVVMDGTAHPTDERLDGHPRCRCAMVPATKSWADLGLDGIEDTTPAVRSGKDWLTRQTPTIQRHVLGSGKFREWKAGRITLDEVVARPSSPRWGTMRRERSLIEIRQGRNANYHPTTKAEATPPAVPVRAQSKAEAKLADLIRALTESRDRSQALWNNGNGHTPERVRLAKMLENTNRALQANRDKLAALSARLDRALAPQPGLAKLPRKAARTMPAQVRRDAQDPLGEVRRDTTKTNPGYGQPGYNINCVHVVATHELRRRGYAVTASPLPEPMRKYGGRDAEEALARWVTPEGELPEFQALAPKALEAQVAKWPVGARGWVRVVWRSGGGHIFNVEHTAEGVRFLEAQRGNPEPDIAAYWANTKRGSTVLVRVDNLVPTDDVLELVNER